MIASFFFWGGGTGIWPIIETVVFLGRQNIPLRGHRDDGLLGPLGGHGPLCIRHCKGTSRMQSILGLKCYKCISTRDNDNVITYNGVFVVGQSIEDISDCKGLRDAAMATNFWPEYAKNITKMAITSVVCDISMQSLVLR